ncbi:hypothetical protein NFI96_004993, partial [Prochilodus magdalenae]
NLRDKAGSKPSSSNPATLTSRRAEAATPVPVAISTQLASTPAGTPPRGDFDTADRANTTENSPLLVPTLGATSVKDSDTPPRWFTAFTEEFDHKMEKTIRVLNESLQPIRERLDSLERTFASHRSSITELESTSAAHDSRLERLEQECRSLKHTNVSLLEKLDDLENRSRRCNLRIVGIPEGLELNDPIGFTTELFKELFGPNLFQSQPIIERAHRLGRSPAAGGETGGRPRVMIVLFHSFQDRERVMRKSKDELIFKGHRIRIFPDYSTELSRRRAAFRPIKATLFQKGFRFALLYPARLRVIVNGATRIFESPEAARKFCDEHLTCDEAGVVAVLLTRS